MLHSSTREVTNGSDDVSLADPLTMYSQIIYAYEEESGEDVVASLDFWSRGQ